jgi:EmrB/QacA subfamily drug resistance transporter
MTTTVDAPRMTHREVLEALSGILLGMFVSMLATSVVSSSLPRIIADLHGKQSAFTWVVTATLLTTTISTPIWGKLADLVNRKLLIQLALVITVLSSAAAGLSHSTEMLIAMRAFQGLGAGGLTALGTILLADIISPRERGRYMGYMGAVMGVSMVGGPLLGGFLTDSSLGWRWNFFVGLPFAIAAIAVLQRTLHLPPLRKRKVRIDYLGATLISVGVAGLLLWVTFAGDKFDWASWQSFAMAGGSVVVLAVAVWVESRAAEPIIPLHLFKNRTLVLAVVGSVAVGIAMFGTSVFIGQYMQLARGKTPTQSGLLTIPMIAGVLVASTISGRIISRTGKYKKFMIAGAIVLSAGLGLMGTIHSDTSLVLVSLYMVVLGSGVGMLMQNLVLAVQNTLAVDEIGTGSATVAFFRTLGGAIGVSVLGAVLANKLSDYLVDGLAKAHITLPPGSVTSGQLPELGTLPTPIRMIFEHSMGESVADLFAIATPIALISLVAVLFLKEVPLGRRSGIEQRVAADVEPVAPSDEDPTDAGEVLVSA